MTTEPSQAYKVLARKYRPTTFPELIGQDALVQTLSNAIAQDRIAHAFLLTGIRGVGKTTTARLIARALNCIGEDGKGGPTITPCGVCEHCLAISEDRHTDIIEMDAASKTGVNDIREVIDNSRYLPVTARYKIYIIDEVHMLSTNAFNALLKTLEEPPAHVKFIFATTELRKIPITIISRCQRFDLKRIDSTTLTTHLHSISQKEGYQVDDDALALIAHAAEGSVRDGLSLLDQAMATIENQDAIITATLIRDMLGLSNKSELFNLLKPLIAGDIAAALNQFQTLYEEGSDAISILRELLSLTHFITRLHITPSLADDITIAEIERVEGKELVEEASISQLARLWQLLLKGLQEAIQSPNPYQAGEMVLIRIAYSSTLPSPESVIRDLKTNNVSNSNQKNNPTTNIKAATPDGETTNQPANNPATITSYNDIVALCKEHREMILYHHLLEDVHLVAFSPGKLILRAGQYAPNNLVSQLKQHLKAWAGQDWNITLTQEGGAPTLAEQTAQSEAQLKEEATQHPDVQKILETFPGAAITNVKQTTT